MPEWTLVVRRIRCQAHAGRVRTCGAYEVLIDGEAQPDLRGCTVEAPGPGDNGPGGRNRRRVQAGRYALARQGSPAYRTMGYDRPYDAGKILPALLFILPEGVRDELLIRPAHPPRASVPGSNLWLSSIGCINPTGPLAPHEPADFPDSCNRVEALIDSLASCLGDDFHNAASGTLLPGAYVEIRGEPGAA